MYGDPDALDRLATHLETKADTIREHAVDHVRRGQAADWVSASAQAYRDRVTRDAASAQRVADELERAAELLRAHADELRQTLATIARIEREASDWFRRVVRDAVEDAPWTTWPIGPSNLPAPGDARWLEVGRFMRGQGVL